MEAKRECLVCIGGEEGEGPNGGGWTGGFGVGVLFCVFSFCLAGGEKEIGEPYYAGHAGWDGIWIYLEKPAVVA